MQVMMIQLVAALILFSLSAFRLCSLVSFFSSSVSFLQANHSFDQHYCNDYKWQKYCQNLNTTKNISHHKGCQKFANLFHQPVQHIACQEQKLFEGQLKEHQQATLAEKFCQCCQESQMQRTHVVCRERSIDRCWITSAEDIDIAKCSQLLLVEYQYLLFYWIPAAVHR